MESHDASKQGFPRGKPSRPIPRGPPAIGRLVAGGVFPAEEAPNHVLLNWYEADQGSEGGGGNRLLQSLHPLSVPGFAPSPMVLPGSCAVPPAGNGSP